MLSFSFATFGIFGVVFAVHHHEPAAVPSQNEMMAVERPSGVLVAENPMEGERLHGIDPFARLGVKHINGPIIRPANHADNRVDRRLAKNQTGTRRVVVAFRQRQGRTLTHVVRHEGEGVEIAKRIVDRLAVIHADEASHWDALHAGWATRRINHSIAYSTPEGCTNQAESFFSRLRRMVRGQHHYVSPQHLHQYANHAAWLEDHRRLDNGALCHRALGLALGHDISPNWKGYWQRRRAA